MRVEEVVRGEEVFCSRVKNEWGHVRSRRRERCVLRRGIEGSEEDERYRSGRPRPCREAGLRSELGTCRDPITESALALCVLRRDTQVCTGKEGEMHSPEVELSLLELPGDLAALVSLGGLDDLALGRLKHDLEGPGGITLSSERDREGDLNQYI